jgi:hypothetical protein
MNQEYHRKIANQILTDVAKVNPYMKKDGPIAYLYAAGYLAGFIASLAERDPYIYKEFKQLVEEQSRIYKR